MAKSDLNNVSISVLQSELSRRQKTIQSLRDKQANLSAKRDDLIQQIADLESQINELGGEAGLAEIAAMISGAVSAPAPASAPAKAKPGRKKKATHKKATRKQTAKKTTGKRAAAESTEAPIGAKTVDDMSLADALATVLDKSAPMRIPEIRDAVLKIGYQTNSANFRTIISQTLKKDERFKKAGRGLYVLK